LLGAWSYAVARALGKDEGMRKSHDRSNPDHVTADRRSGPLRTIVSAAAPLDSDKTASILRQHLEAAKPIEQRSFVARAALEDFGVEPALVCACQAPRRRS
jgi:hypothetical protein